VSNFSLASTYLPAFRAAVTRGGATGIMCSYNAINGVPTCASAMLNHTLRASWGFDGYITSDTGAVEDIYRHHAYLPDGPRAACAALSVGGTDIDSGKVYSESLLEGVRLGYCSMDDVRRSLRRTLGLRFRLGLFDPIEDQPYWHVPPEVVASAAHQQLNLLAARSSIVLLKNEPPTGAGALAADGVGADSSIFLSKNEQPIGATEDLGAATLEVDDIGTGLSGGRLGSMVPPTLPLPTGRSLAVIGPHANVGAALVGNYVGQVCPGASSSDLSCIQTVASALAAFASRTTVVEGSGLMLPVPGGVKAAVAAARAADHVVLMLGIGQSIEGEGLDRTSIGLPKAQTELAAAMLALGKPLVLVLINGGVVSASETFGAAPAIVEAFYPGVLGARAIAETLFGANPHCCGKLPFTLYPEGYVSEVKMSDMEVRPSEASGSPGRTYKWYSGPALFRFGDGLALTSFDLRAADGSVSTPIVLSIAKVRRRAEEEAHGQEPPLHREGQKPPLLQLSIAITNTGTREGDEVPMLFVDPPASAAILGFSPPRTQLAAFERVHLFPGESRVVTFNLDVAEALALVNEAGDAALVPGSFVLRCAIGGGKEVTQEVDLQGDVWVARPFLS
jgi:beta-glucosidase-like glycosyl hydrolase